MSPVLLQLVLVLAVGCFQSSAFLLGPLSTRHSLSSTRNDAAGVDLNAEALRTIAIEGHGDGENFLRLFNPGTALLVTSFLFQINLPKMSGSITSIYYLFLSKQHSH